MRPSRPLLSEPRRGRPPLAGLAVRGRVLAPAPDAYHRDYGNAGRVAPLGVVVAASAEDVAEAVRWAGERGVRVVPRGHGCSSGGHTLTPHLVVDTTALSRIGEPEGGAVWMGAGARWGDAQEAMVARGLSHTVLVNNALATVGGTLAVGGFGARSVRRGTQAGQALALEIVTGSGERVRADHRENGDLFRHALCGLGQAGIVTAARMPVEAYRPYTEVLLRWFADDVPVEEIARTVETEPGWEIALLIFLIAERKWKLVLGRTHAERPARVAPGAVVATHYFRDVFSREAAFVEPYARAHVQAGAMADAAEACRLWSDFLLPAANAPEFFRRTRPLFTDRRMLWGFYGTVLHRGADAPAPLPLSPVPPAELAVTMGPYCVVPPARLEEYRGRFDEAAAACLELGGRVYLYGHLPRLPRFLERQFGDRTVEGWRAVRRAHDPRGVIGTPLLEEGAPCAA